MLDQILFKKDFRCFKTGDRYFFQPGLNVIVGDNGSGKSTLLGLIGTKSVGTLQNSDVIEFKTDSTTLSYYLDIEYNKARYSQGDLQHGFQVAHRFSSHGESTNSLIKSISKIPDGSTVLIDEPDLALSIKSILNLHKLLIEQSKTKQIICSVHNLLLMQLSKEVLVIDKKYWLSANDYIQSQLGKVIYYV